MKYAKSIFREIEESLVDAFECDYESYKEKGLLCPFCDQPVFLVKRKGDPPTAYFSHFKAKDDRDYQCENRALSAEGRSYLLELSPERRNQRLEIINRHVCALIAKANQIDPNHDPIKDVIRAIGEMALNELVRMIHNRLEQNKAKVMEGVYDTITKLITDEELSRIRERLSAIEFEAYQTVVDLDKRLQLVISKEVLNFLLSSAGAKAFRRLVATSIMVTGARNEEFHTGSFYTRTIVKIPIMILSTPWQKVIEEQKQKKKGFGK